MSQFQKPKDRSSWPILYDADDTGQGYISIDSRLCSCSQRYHQAFAISLSGPRLPSPVFGSHRCGTKLSKGKILFSVAELSPIHNTKSQSVGESINECTSLSPRMQRCDATEAEKNEERNIGNSRCYIHFACESHTGNLICQMARDSEYIIFSAVSHPSSFKTDISAGSSYRSPLLSFC